MCFHGIFFLELEPHKMYIENDGHSAIITIEPNDALDIPNVIQGNLPGTYQLGQIRFRWGEDGKSGSEHYLFGVSSEVIIFFELDTVRAELGSNGVPLLP